jgi:hypothetical protein
LLFHLCIVLSLSLLHTLHSLLVALANFVKVVVQHRVSAWTDIIFDAFASAVIGASNAPAVSKQKRKPEKSHFSGGSLSSTTMK